VKITRTTFEPGDDESDDVMVDSTGRPLTGAELDELFQDSTITDSTGRALTKAQIDKIRAKKGLLTKAEVDEVLRSPKFRRWKPKKAVVKTPVGRVGEEHYSPRDLATAWGVSEKVVRNLFRNEEGVLKIGRNGSRSRQGYWTLRIPQSVADRVHRRLSA
jgi:hypothetical protein